MGSVVFIGKIVFFIGKIVSPDNVNWICIQLLLLLLLSSNVSDRDRGYFYLCDSSPASVFLKLRCIFFVKMLSKCYCFLKMCVFRRMLFTLTFWRTLVELSSTDSPFISTTWQDPTLSYTLMEICAVALVEFCSTKDVRVFEHFCVHVCRLLLSVCNHFVCLCELMKNLSAICHMLKSEYFPVHPVWSVLVFGVFVCLPVQNRCCCCCCFSYLPGLPRSALSEVPTPRLSAACPCFRVFSVAIFWWEKAEEVAEENEKEIWCGRTVQPVIHQEKKPCHRLPRNVLAHSQPSRTPTILTDSKGNEWKQGRRGWGGGGDMCVCAPTPPPRQKKRLEKAGCVHPSMFYSHIS